MGRKVLYHGVVLCLCLMMSVHVKAKCTRPNFGANVILSDEFLQKDNFQEGDQVTFNCVIGYKPADIKDSKTVTCVGNKWTQLALQCTRKSCGSPPDFPNGKYEIPNGVLFGDTITGVCNKGYVIVSYGSNQRTCRSNGEWDGRAPVCEVIKCVLPSVVENGYIEGWPEEDTIYEYESAITYRCNSKFTLVGSETLVCSENGSFQPEPPKCVDGSCPNPVVTNGFRTAGKSPPYNVGHFLEYECREGYEMNGENHIVCRVQGWDPEPPQCIGYCGTPSFEGYVVISNPSGLKKFTDGSRVEFECKSGYKPVNLEASKFVTCVDTRWTALELTCKDGSCGPPAFGGHVTISKPFASMTKFPDASNVTFECKSGYEPVELKASKSVTCVDTKWTALELTCKGYCGPPAFGENVITSKQLDSMNKFPDGHSIHFECKSGYVPVDLKASREVICVDTRWTALELSCKDESSTSNHLLYKILIPIALIIVIAAVGVVAYIFKKKKSPHKSGLMCFYKVFNNTL